MSRAVGRARPSFCQRVARVVVALMAVVAGALMLVTPASAETSGAVIYRDVSLTPIWPKITDLVITGTPTGFTLAFNWQQPAFSDSCPGGIGSNPCWSNVSVYPELGVYEGSFADNPPIDDASRGWGLNSGPSLDFPDQTIDLGVTLGGPRSGHYTGSFSFDRSTDLTVMLFGGPPYGDTWAGSMLFLAGAELQALAPAPGTLGSTFGEVSCTGNGAIAEVSARVGDGTAGRSGVTGYVSVWHDIDADGTHDPGEPVQEYSNSLSVTGQFVKSVMIQEVGVTDVTVSFTDLAVSATDRIYAGDSQYVFPAGCVGSTGVERWSGASRYETAVAISKKAFPTGADAVYVASGGNYPDALAGAPIAGMNGGPVLLTRADALPDAVKSELARLTPSKIVVLGGEGVVSAALITQLQTFGAVERWSGASRYETAAAISKKAFPTGADVVYVASGGNYPDALAGAPIAGMNGGPVLLTRADALPDAVKSELARLTPSKIVVLGGEGVVSAAVMAELENLVSS